MKDLLDYIDAHLPQEFIRVLLFVLATAALVALTKGIFANISAIVQMIP